MLFQIVCSWIPSMLLKSSFLSESPMLLKKSANSLNLANKLNFPPITVSNFINFSNKNLPSTLKKVCQPNMTTTCRIKAIIWIIMTQQEVDITGICGRTPPLHTVSFDWFLSDLEWIVNLEFCLLKLLIFYQKLL